MSRAFSRVTAAGVVFAFLMGLSPTRAAEFVLTGTGWKIDFDDTKVISPTFGVPGAPTSGSGLDGTLDLDRIIFTDLNPIEIKFIQTAQQTTADDPVNFGLRITSILEIENSSGRKWSGFIMRLIDQGPEFDSGESLHPGYAHFHNLLSDNGNVLETPPFTLNGSENPSTTVRTDVWRFGNGTFDKNGTAMLWKGIGIHQWERHNEVRDFTLQLTPVVPEPGTISLLAVAGVGLVGGRWLRRKGVLNRA